MENHAADLASSMSGVPEHLAGSQVVAYLSELYAALNSVGTAHAAELDPTMMSQATLAAELTQHAAAAADLSHHATAAAQAVSDHPDAAMMGSAHIADAAMSVGPEHAADQAHSITGMAAAAAGAPLAYAAGSAMAENLDLLNGVATWSTARLSEVQHVDPEAFATLKTSIAALLKALTQLLSNATGPDMEGFGEALSLTVQAMLTDLRGGDPEQVAALNAAAAEAVAASGGLAGTDMRMLLGITAGTIGLVVSSVPPVGYDRMSDVLGDDTDEIPSRYNPDHLDVYFKKRPVQSLTRNTIVTAKIAGFCASLLTDMAFKRWDANIARRAEEARETIQTLGPAYIKMGQALSTRTDVIAPTYIKSLRRLQDDVKPFDTKEAHRLIEEELGAPIGDTFEWLGEDPVAAASLGQVYKGRLLERHGGAEVAVKVQRPRVLQEAALDIYLLRRNCKMLGSLPFMHGDWAAVLDDWALRFFQEMDYQLEAYNTMTFKRHMASLEGVVVPDIWPEFSSRYLLTTSWITGEKLSESSTDDVLALCDTILNAYLIQLLETGFLHADPHPGNLLRTPDGKIAILDYGLMSEVTEEQRVSLVEYITHLSLEDWDGIADDLVTLGFVPEGYSDFRDLDVKPILKEMMGQLISGGGVGNISAARIGEQILALQEDLKEEGKNYMIVIPPYFALIVRTFSVIEGIALTADPDYAIVPRCMPYLSRRLLTDNNPRMKEALHSLLYGDKTHIDVERLHGLIKAFGQFSTGPAGSAERAAAGPSFGAAASESRVKGRPAYPFAPEEPVVSDAVKQALKVVFSKEGTYAQELIVDELVSAVDALSREALGEAVRVALGSATAVAALQSVEALGPLRSMLMPMPLTTFTAMAPNVKLTDDDKQALFTIRYVLDALVPSLQNVPEAALAGRNAVQMAGEIMPMVPELLPGMQSTLELFTRQLVRRLALRLAEDLSDNQTGAQRA